MRRSCGIPDSHSHKEGESSWHGRDKRRRFTDGHLGPAPCCLDGNPPQEYPGMSRNRVIRQDDI
ncbi:hypothetical protein NQZ68_030738 [Dissostichus eleginoides]|nr:hypothetical protein NQZ68_030738 [Dissostichus eleginoides]